MENLLTEIEEFCDEFHLSNYTFGYKAIKNGRLIDRLKNGGRVWPDTEQRIRNFMSNYRLTNIKRNAA